MNRQECSWCGLVLRWGLPQPISHGICGYCAAKMRKRYLLDYGPYYLIGSSNQAPEWTETLPRETKTVGRG